VDVFPNDKIKASKLVQPGANCVIKLTGPVLIKEGNVLSIRLPK
jgi:hypothetical protein